MLKAHSPMIGIRKLPSTGLEVFQVLFGPVFCLVRRLKVEDKDKG
jgi:hypothetical protein